MPPLTVKVTFETVSGGAQVAVLRVPASSQPVATSDGRLSVRYLDTHGRPGCRPLYPHELISWRADRGQVDLSALPIPGARWEDLDPLEFARLRRMVEENRGDAALLELSDVEIARALGLVRTEDGALFPTLAGLLLIGKERPLREHVAAHEVAFQVLRGTDVAMNEFRRWPLLRTLEWVIEAFQVRNEERELNVGMFRVGVPAYDPRGFREAVNNALIHRDYGQLGAVHIQMHENEIRVNNALIHRDYGQLGAVHIQMHENEIRISNPGGFVRGVRLDNLLVTEPRPRNPCLADAFKRIGLVERTGRGVAIIYSGQLRNGRLPPSYSSSTEASVTVVLPGGPADLDFVQLIVTEENRRQRALSVSELLILNHMWRERAIDTPTASELIQRDDAEARAILEGLVEAGLVERRGSKRGRDYLLSAGVYREMGRPEAYVYARGFEPLQMEQMILQYVAAHSSIARREAAELCRISRRRAGYLLQKMTERGMLERVARGRSTFYRIP